MNSMRAGQAADDSILMPGHLLAKIPGRARPRAQALREFEENVTKLRLGCNPVLWPIFVPDAKDMYRWRLQLECGCIHEVYTRGKDRFPDEGTRRDPITRHNLPAGEFWCSNNHGDAVSTYRDIVEWIDRKVREIPADSEEPIDEEIDADTCARIRRTEPCTMAFWKVRLNCGHVYESVATDVSWKPGDTPKRFSAEHTDAARAMFEKAWAEEEGGGWPEEGPERDHIRRMLDLRWPRPEPERDCWACRNARRITGYQRVDWLIPRSKAVKPLSSAAIERKKNEARLAQAEAEVRRLRRQLDLPVEIKD